MAWQTLTSRTAYENPWIKVREDRVIKPSGEEALYGVIVLRPAVFVVALDDDDRVLLVTVDRHTVGSSIEVAAGGSDGQEPLIAAQRELAEEAGFSASQWTHIGLMNALNGVAEAPQYVYLARGLQPVGSPDDLTASQTEEGITETRFVAFDEVLRMIADGRITDGETVGAIAYAAIHLGRLSRTA